MMRWGVVVIGRNEGERLKRCLASLRRDGRPTVYVDSGSTDGSLEHARRAGADIVALDMSLPFTAARARNAGFHRLIDRYGDVDLVQFVDGDCEMFDDWFDHAAAAFVQHGEAAIVCGRLRERYPQQTIYNRLCDLEWHTPTGQVDASGGIFAIRSGAFREVGGFEEAMIAGEEPDLGARLRGAGWRIIRLADDMAWHDAATTRFSQWWKRTVRSGHAFMEGHHRHGATPQAYATRAVRSNWFWGLGFPAMLLLAAYPTGGWILLGALAYPAMIARIARSRMRRMGDRPPHALLYGTFIMLGKFPSALGQLAYWRNRLRGAPSEIIEYKTAE